MGVKLFNRVALLNFTNVIGPNGTNSDTKTSHFVGSRWSEKCIHHFTAAPFTMLTFKKSFWTPVGHVTF